MTQDRIIKLKTKMSEYIQELIRKSTPIFESYQTLEEVETGETLIYKAYDGGLKAIENSIYNLTEEDKTELNYHYDLAFSAVYDMIRQAKHRINYEYC